MPNGKCVTESAAKLKAAHVERIRKCAREMPMRAERDSGSVGRMPTVIGAAV